MRPFLRIPLLSLLLVAALALPASAVDYNWIAGTGDYNTVTNWDPEYPGTPTTGDFMYVNNGGTVQITADAMNTPSWVYAGRWSPLGVPNVGTIEQSAGSLGTDSAMISGVRVGYQGATGTYTMTGGEIVASSTLLIGSHLGEENVGGTGTMTMSNGAAITFGGTSFVGYHLTSTGSLTMTDSTANFAGLTVGYGISNPGGDNYDFATGTVELYDSTLTTTGTLTLGLWSNSYGTINLHGTSLYTAEGRTVIGDSNTSGGSYLSPVGGNALVTINGSATMEVTHADFWIASLDAAHGTVTVGDGMGTATLLHSDASAPIIVGRSGGHGTLNINEGGVVIANAIQLGNSAASTSALNIDGGVLQAKAGGALIHGSAGALSAKIMAGGATIDSNGFNVGVLVPLSDVGGLTKQGAGVLSMTAANTYTGATVVEAGTLAVGATGSLATSSLQIAGGATLGLASATAMTGSLSSVSLADTSSLGLALTTSAAGANTIATDTFDLAGGTSTLRIGAQGLTLDTANPYTVMTYNTLTNPGTINAVSLIRGYTANATVAAGTVDVAVSGGLAPGQLVWAGTGTAWDTLGEANWTNSATASPDMFYELDVVQFTDAGSAQPNVELVGRVHPRMIVATAATTNYTIGGAGDLVGEGTMLSKVNAGTLTIDNTGDFSITGLITLAGGTLSMGSNRTLTTLPGNVTISGDGSTTLDTQSGATLVLTGIVGGPNGVRKTGAGTLVLDNSANTYTGPTQILGGTLQVGAIADGGTASALGASSADAANLKLGGGGTLYYTGPDALTDRGFMMAGSGNGTIRLDNNLTMTGQTTSVMSGYLYKTGDGALTLAAAANANDVAYRLYVEDGTVVFAGNAGTSYKMGQYTVPGRAAGNNGTITVLDNTDPMDGPGTTVEFANLRLADAGGGSIGTVNLTGNSRATAVSGSRIGLGASGGSNTTKSLATLNIQDTAQLTVSGNLSVAVWNHVEGRINISDDGVLELTSGRLISGDSNVGSHTAAGGNLGQINLSGNAQLNVPEIYLGQFGTGVGELNISGSASMNVSGYSLFGRSGGTAYVNMSENALITGSNGHLGGTAGGKSTIVMDDDARIEFANWFNMGEADSVGSLTMNDQASIQSSSIDFGWGLNTSSTGVMNQTSSITTGGVNIGVNGENAYGSLTMNDSSVVTATGRVNVGSNGAGIVAELNMNHSATLSTTDAIAIANASGVTATVTMTGDSSLTAVGWFAIGNSYDGSGSGELFLSDNASIASTESRFEIAYGGTGILHIGDGDVTGNAVASSFNPIALGWGTASNDTHARIDLNGGGTLEAPGIITGSDGDGLNPLSSVLNFDGGLLKATADNEDYLTNEGGAIAFEANVLAAGARIDTNGFSIAINAPLTEDAESTGGGLTKLGEGTLALGGMNTYTGATLVEAGALAVNGSIVSDVTVADGAALMGTGTILGDVLAEAGSSVNPGASIGTLTVNGDLTIVGSLDIEYDSDTNTIDVVNVSGTLDLSSASLSFTDIGSGTLANGVYVFANYGCLLGTPTEPVLPTGWSVDYLYDNCGSIALVVVPEPSVLAMLLGLCALLAGCRTRR